jgi:shikimate dehydrogenase
LDWVYVAFPVAAGDGRAAVEAMRILGLAGLSVTMPHKGDVVSALDKLGPVAARLGVVNTISWAHSPNRGELIGDSTDGPGFLDALRGDDGCDPSGRRCVVLGAGGAARAVTLALADAGASSVTVVGRRPVAAESCAQLAGSTGTVGLATADLDGLISASDLVVNTTPVGMSSGDGIPFDIDRTAFHAGQFVCDLIYSPATTPLLAAARVRGAGVANGLGMLIHQAARQVEIWTGRPAPLEAMSAAVVGALGRVGG